jgi:cell division protein ZapB
MVTRRNPLLPILAAVVVLMALFVWFRSGPDAGATDDAEMGSAAREGVPAADADTPADTIRTLTANVAEMNAELDA